jgi:hypothetical protein
MLIRAARTATQPASESGQCASCGKRYHVNGRTGMIRKHYRTIDGLGPHGEAAVCPGSGQVPAKAKAAG